LHAINAQQRALDGGGTAATEHAVNAKPALRHAVLLPAYSGPPTSLRISAPPAQGPVRSAVAARCSATTSAVTVAALFDQFCRIWVTTAAISASDRLLP